MTLAEQCLAQPYWERVRLAAALQCSIKKDKDADREIDPDRGPHLIMAMESLLGERLTAPTRKRMVVNARYIVAYQMRAEGFTLKAIGNLLDKDHATIMHGIGKMMDIMAYSRSYPQEFELFKNFQKLIQQ